MHRLKTAEGHGGGRAIYCHDLGIGEVTAALAYHLDENRELPLLLLALAFRADAGSNRFLRSRTLAAALVLKQYAHAVAGKVGRGGYVDIDLGDPERLGVAHELGFRRAPRLKGFKPGGVHLRQQAG